jgi:hypothetical protein
MTTAPKSKRVSQRNVKDPPRLRKPGRRELVAERQSTAISLRKAGATYEQIGKATGVSTMQAHRDTRRALAAVVANRERDVDALVTLELERLDDVVRSMLPRAREGNSKAAAVLVRASESRRRLLGLDADARLRVELSGRSGGPIVVSDTSRPYEHLSDGEIFERLERVRERLRQDIAEDALARMTADEPLLPAAPVDDSPAARYAAVLAERRRQGGTPH